MSLSAAKELAKAFARISTQRMARLWGCANPPGISIRGTRPDDRERIVKAFRALDPESVHKRFFVPKKELSGEELRRLTESDGIRDVVLVATVPGGNQEIIVGLGRYVRSGASADIAFTVAENYQGRGIASELLRRLTGIARRNGVSQFEADVLADNAPMLKVFQRSGLPMKETQASGIVHLTLFLAGPDALAGRLENLVTGGQREFASGHEPLESIARDLQAGAAVRPAEAANVDEQRKTS